MSGEQSSAEGLITSDAVTAGARLRRRIFLIAGIVLGIVLIAGVGAFVVTRWHPWQASPKKSSSSQQSSKLPKPPPTPAELLAAAQKQLEQAKTSEQKSAAYQQLGAAYTAGGQSSKAIASYQSALDNVSTNDTRSKTTILFGEASTYYYSGQKAKQIAVLQQIITLLQGSTDPYAQSKIDYAKMTINALEGGER